MRHFYSLSY